ncbi:hypothetical protein [Microbacterium sp. No. 7]|uniref:hypothetical protein n=1 Tax=Microbacterium sp. No. 7 TaxID=1714373 RepID=UPI0006CF8991|nr:hypothetical protein [Microbacterium sp. No. 7]ALJ18745.1 hypothetical protein AOA12_01980 [Microbacterium sp. No. 7]
MNRLTHRGITLIGAVGVIAILIIGVLVALPLYLRSVSTQAQADQIVATNGLQQTQLDLLDRESQRMAELAEEVAALRAQIPDAPERDQVIERIVTAAEVAGVAVKSVQFSDALPFVERTQEVVDAAGAQAAASGGDLPAQRQIQVTTRVEGPGAGGFGVFLDTLRSGPRLAAVTSVLAEEISGDNGLGMIVTFLVFVDVTGVAG